MVNTPSAAESVPFVALSSVWIMAPSPQPENNALGKLSGQGVSGSELAEVITGVPPPGLAVTVIGVPRQPERGFTKRHTLNCRFVSTPSLPVPNSFRPISFNDHCM